MFTVETVTGSTLGESRIPESDGHIIAQVESLAEAQRKARKYREISPLGKKVAIFRDGEYLMGGG